MCKLIGLIFGYKWLPATTSFKIFFVIVLVKAIASNAGPLLHAEGNTVADFKLSILNVIMIIPIVYYCTLYGGIEGAAIGILIVGFISVVVAYHFFVKSMTGHGFLYYLWKPLLIVFLSSSFFFVTFEFYYKLLILFTLLILIIILFFSTIKASYKYLFSQFFN